MSSSIQISDSWPGFAGIKFLVVFGDSYSSCHMFHQTPIPTARLPLGSEWPGFTYAEPEKPNWIGYLISQYAPRVKYNPVDGKTYYRSGEESSGEPPILVFDCAVGGDTVGGVKGQVQRCFLENPTISAASKLWQPETTLFVTWVGINDCGSSLIGDCSKSIQQLFSLQEQLYDAGARNFLFCDVPPIDRSPAGTAITRVSRLDIPGRYTRWNTALDSGLRKFSADYPKVTTLLYSSYATFTRMLDDPVGHGFTPDDTCKRGGGIWIDHIHPTSKVHDLIAKDLAHFLGDVAPTATSIPDESNE